MTVKGALGVWNWQGKWQAASSEERIVILAAQRIEGFAGGGSMGRFRLGRE